MREDERRKRAVRYRRNTMKKMMEHRRRAARSCMLVLFAVLFAGVPLLWAVLDADVRTASAAECRGNSSGDASASLGAHAGVDGVRPTIARPINISDISGISDSGISDMAFYLLQPRQSFVWRSALVDGSGECRAGLAWPVTNPDIIRPFDPPAKPWLPGHRGLDLAAASGDPLFAPADGVIGFRGSVGGKSVVTIRHGNLTSTFEPARTDAAVGAAVRRGVGFARVQGSSDHCDNRCVHWGVKRGENDYLDPQALASVRRIVLKTEKSRAWQQ